MATKGCAKDKWVVVWALERVGGVGWLTIPSTFTRPVPGHRSASLWPCVMLYRATSCYPIIVYHYSSGECIVQSVCVFCFSPPLGVLCGPQFLLGSQSSVTIYNSFTRSIHRPLTCTRAQYLTGQQNGGVENSLTFVSFSGQVVHGALLRAKHLEREATVAAEFIANDAVRNFIAAELAPVQGHATPSVTAARSSTTRVTPTSLLSRYHALLPRYGMIRYHLMRYDLALSLPRVINVEFLLQPHHTLWRTSLFTAYLYRR